MTERPLTQKRYYDYDWITELIRQWIYVEALALCNIYLDSSIVSAETMEFEINKLRLTYEVRFRQK